MKLLLVMVFMAVLISSCDGMMQHRKRYYFSLSSNSDKNIELLNFYFYKFNSNFNVDVLNFLPYDHGRADDELSTILMIPHMSEREGEDNDTLGWAQWRTCTKVSSFRTLLVSPQKILTKIHTMHLEFDETRFLEWHTSEQLDERKKAEYLFLHEVGHGFHLMHDPSDNSIMYESINDAEKDYQKYYSKVSNFLEN